MSHLKLKFNINTWITEATETMFDICLFIENHKKHHGPEHTERTEETSTEMEILEQQSESL